MTSTAKTLFIYSAVAAAVAAGLLLGLTGAAMRRQRAIFA
jgi:hypothetical protein